MPEPNFRMEKLTAYLAVDPRDHSEGVMAYRAPNGHWVPLIGADEDRINSLRPVAIKLAKATGTKEIRIVRFEQRVDVEVIQP